MNGQLPLPDRTYEGGVLPVNADRIEKRLAEVWSLATHTNEAGQELVKVCLANIVVICDGLTRPEAELLTIEIAREHPSRVILTVIDEELKSYYSFVRTSCTRDPDTGIIRCWEIIELVAETAKVRSIVGALRSLLVDSVPVVTVDFRPYQTTPELDEILVNLSELVLVNAEVVPTSQHEKPFLPLRWYRTLPVRLLIGDLFSLAGGSRTPTRFTLYSEPGRDTYDDLLAGWLLARLEAKEISKTPTGVLIHRAGGDIEIELREKTAADSSILAVAFSGEETRALISAEGKVGSAASAYLLSYDGHTLTRLAKERSLADYIVGTLQDSSESREYIAVAKAISRMRSLT